jgi:hypothetical protein
MWIIFHEARSIFTHIDKNVFALVEDKDVLEFQRTLAATTGEMSHPVIEYCGHLQNFVGNTYFARRYIPMTPRTSKIAPREPPKLEIPKASLFRDVEPQNPCNTEQ